MKVFYCDHISFRLPQNHRFPQEKYRILRERVESSGLIDPADLIVPAPATDEQLLLVHDADYLAKVKFGTLSEKEIRRIGLPWSSELLTRSRYSVGGTIAACHAAMKDGTSMNLSGGTHHAHADHGAGFCVFNDVAVAARSLLTNGNIEQVIIIDCDVHHGDGTAEIFSNDPSVFTFSIHGAKNYPYYKPKGDLDIALRDGADDSEYIKALEDGLSEAFEQSRPGLAIYLAGADPFTDDMLGRLALTKGGLATRDRTVLGECTNRRIPIAIVMSGGYGQRIDDTVDIHFTTFQIAFENAPKMRLI